MSNGIYDRISSVERNENIAWTNSGSEEENDSHVAMESCTCSIRVANQ